ncbi:MAG: cell division protein FtsZ, partial [Solirubrobacteraceae bacterium]|nr:cell division protein FtsZ [Solirubrobacteraceae bacterium]
TVIATGFDKTGGRRLAPRAERARPSTTARERDERPAPRDRGPRIDDRQRSSLEISDDDIDIPPFLR